MNDRVSRFSAAVKSATFVNDTIIVRVWSYKHPDNVISELVEIIIILKLQMSELSGPR